MIPHLVRSERSRRTVVLPVLVPLMVFVLLVAACGEGIDIEVGSDRSSPDPTADGAGLAVRITGLIDDDAICPGGNHACLAYIGDVVADSDGRAWVAGRIFAGRLEIDQQQPLAQRLDRDYSNRCPDRNFIGPPPGEWMEANEGMTEGDADIPDGYVDFWDSDDGVFHIGIANNTVEWEQYLESEGLVDRVCLVEFPYSSDELRVLSHDAEALIASWGASGASTGDPWEGVLNVYLDWLDVDRRAELERLGADNGGVPISAHAPVEVLDDTFAAYEAAIAEATVEIDPASSLAATCGPVRFESIPPNLEEFPALDAEAEAALEELVTGETGLEAGFLDAGDRIWSMAHRSGTELVLFGQNADSAANDAVYARFDRTDGDQTFRPSGWGGCSIEIESSTYGNASIAFDSTRPADPAGTELPLLINERNCASGRAPEGRDIVPVVTESESDVVIIVLVEPSDQGECPSNPWHPITVTLDSPLGNRTVLDGHTSPPVTISEATPGDHG